ncbi:hypothetical protein [Natronomonas marina]|uniref:hypothetical protein n=1 Tax=Natronomonas marina TaxID=2961939 RepID=UPI0020C99F6C|nr:hypothetical protein [Natronomonas marina]
MSDDIQADAQALYEHLAATAERPVERSASRLLGEAEAVADDMRGCEVEVIEQRAAVVLELLDEVDQTGDDVAANHVASARELAAHLAGGTAA